MKRVRGAKGRLMRELVAFWEARPAAKMTQQDIIASFPGEDGPLSRQVVWSAMDALVDQGQAVVVKRSRHNAPTYAKGTGDQRKRAVVRRRKFNDKGLALSRAW